MSFWKKRIKNVKELSKATGIDEEKIKELKEGKREIGGETMENILNKINEINKKTKLEKNVEKKEMVDWIKSQDFQKLREDFNFKTQKDLAIAIGVSPGTFSDCIKKPEKYNEVATKIYKFFQDDFNKNIKDKKSYSYKTSNSTKKVDYLRKLGLAKACEKANCNGAKLAQEIGISLPSLYNIFNGNTKTDSETVMKAYGFIKSKSIDSSVDKTKERLNSQRIHNKEITNWYKRTNINELMKKYNIVSYRDLAERVGISKTTAAILAQKKTANTTIAVERLYNYFNNLEENAQNKPNNEQNAEININTPIDDKVSVNEPKNNDLEDNKEIIKDENKKITKKELKRINKYRLKRIKELLSLINILYIKLEKKQDKIAKLEKQIERYEILIDRLK